MNKKLFKMITPILLIGLSMASMGAGVYCWYTANRQTSVSIVGIKAMGSDFKSVDCVIYRGDGATYNCSTNTFYDSDGNVVSDSSFSMLEYDRLITEKNTFNNLVFIFGITYNAGVDTSSSMSLTASISCSSSSIFEDFDSKYALSDVTKFLYKPNDGTVDVAQTTLNTSTVIYQNATTFLNTTSDSNNYQGFLTSDTSTIGYSKSVNSLTFNLTIPSASVTDQKATVFCNVAYNESYLSSFFTYKNVGDASFSGVATQTFDFSSDLTFSLTSES